MPRPTTKDELIKKSNEQYDKVWQLINSFSDEEKHGTFDLDGKEAHWQRDHNIRDILIHLYEWHQLLLDYVQSNTSGQTKQFLPSPYTWKTYGDMNVVFWKKHQNTPYDEAKKLLESSHQVVMALVDNFSDPELFTKAYFSWTGTTSLGSYFISATSSHYDWAIKKLKKYQKSLHPA